MSFSCNFLFRENLKLDLIEAEDFEEHGIQIEEK